MIPTPCVSILHPPRAPQVPYTPKINFFNIPMLLYVYPIDPFKGLEAMVGIARSKVMFILPDPAMVRKDNPNGASALVGYTFFPTLQSGVVRI